MSDVETLRQIEQRVRSSLCPTLNFATGRETIEARITQQDFETLLGLLDRMRLAERERCASLFESVDPASDDERFHNVPGAGAMGAVLEFRDLIRNQQA